MSAAETDAEILEAVRQCGRATLTVVTARAGYCACRVEKGLWNLLASGLVKRRRLRRKGRVGTSKFVWRAAR